MNTYRILFLLSFMLFWGNRVMAQTDRAIPYLRAQADVAKSYPAIIKLNVFSPFALTANLAYEKFINPNHSVQLGVYYSNFYLRPDKLEWIPLPEGHYHSFGLTPEFRFYLGSPGRPKLNGWFLAPFFRFTYTRIKQQTVAYTGLEQNSKDFKARIGHFSVGSVGGYKFILNERFSLEAFIGPSVRIHHWYSANSSLYSKSEFIRFPIALRSGVTLGYAF